SSGGDRGTVMNHGKRQVPAGLRFQPSEVTVRAQSDYLAQLAELPLNFDKANFALQLRADVPAHQRAAVREVHLMRDTRDPNRDTLIVIFDDNEMVSVSARDFTVNWQVRRSGRTFHAPVMT